MSIKQPDRALSQQMRKIIDRAERDAERAYGGRCGMVMLFVPFGRDDSELQYIANVQRADGIGMLRALFKRWNIPVEDVPAHDKQ